jgi:hypothetical protein
MGRYCSRSCPIFDRRRSCRFNHLVCAGLFLQHAYRQFEVGDRSGNSPDQAKSKIEELEKRVKETIGSRWESLTKDEAARLSAAVAKLEKRRIQVMYANQGKALARSIADAFEAAGWNDMHFSEGGGLEVGLSTGRGNGMALRLKEAIEVSTRFKKVHSFGPTEPDIPGIVFVGVGINPD